MHPRLIETSLGIIVVTGLTLYLLNEPSERNVITSPEGSVLTENTFTPADSTVNPSEGLNNAQPRPVEPLFFPTQGSSFTEEQIAEYNARHVEPYNPIVGQDCKSVNEQGIVSICEAILERPPHAYKTIPLNELQLLSYADPLAVLYLAFRIQPPSNATELEFTQTRKTQRGLIVKASALSGKTGPLIKFSEWKLGGGVLAIPTENGIEISYDLDSLAMKAAVLNVAAEMGDDRARPKTSIIKLAKIIEEELPKRASKLG